MNNVTRIGLIIATIGVAFSTCLSQSRSSFSISKNYQIIVGNKNEPFQKLMSQFLNHDIQQVFGKSAARKTRNKIVLRLQYEKTKNIPNNLIQEIDRDLANKWEVFSLKSYIVKNDHYLIVSGSDKRGLAYGVFTISEKIGVSPWYFWADVPIKKRSNSLSITDTLSVEPSVKYRGIFINDEDWGLQPWASKTFETDIKDIGPKTYAKVFELLLRLKANLIWPAMHESTKAFYFFPQNKEVARQYEIVVGTSHAEPMMRNNVDEWIDSTMGQYNYLTNKEKIKDYWAKRISEIKDYDILYTIGMRGKHDSKIEGVNTNVEAVKLTNTIIEDQQLLLEKLVKKPIKEIPQVITLYKEVLELYKLGLKVPEHITLIWPDDNYGYIKSLSNENEQKRTGGNGVYYHASYWGRPHDYLWLGTTNPALLRFEMQKAYTLGNNKVWVINVGDIKAIEYPTQLFLDMAYNMKPFLDNFSVWNHLRQWALKNLGNEKCASILQKNFELAFERKPEFMGWSRVEPITTTHPTAYTLAEGTVRMNAFLQLEKEVEEIQLQDKSYLSSFIQLVKYPVFAASKMNMKFLYLDRFYTKPETERSELDADFLKAIDAYEHIKTLTIEYNQVNNGKWNHSMSMMPRMLPVFKNPRELKNVEQKREIPSTLKLKMAAGSFSRITKTQNAWWEKNSELGFSKNALVSKPFTLTKSLNEDTPTVEYDFDIIESGNYTIQVQAIPLHPINRDLGQKINISADGNSWQILNFETFDRSEEWKENVLSNKTIKKTSALFLEKGKHTIKLKMIDPGVLIDYIMIDVN